MFTRRILKKIFKNVYYSHPMTAYNRIHKLGIDNWQIDQIRTSTQWYYQCIVLDSRRLAQVQFLKSNYTDYSGNLVKQFQFWRVVVSLSSFYFQESLLQQHHCPNMLYLAKLVLRNFFTLITLRDIAPLFNLGSSTASWWPHLRQLRFDGSDGIEPSWGNFRSASAP